MEEGGREEGEEQNTLMNTKPNIRTTQTSDIIDTTHTHTRAHMLTKI